MSNGEKKKANQDDGGDFNPKKLDSRQSSSGSSGGKSQIALVVWLLIFLGLGIFVLFNHGSKTVTKWSQSKFEKELASGHIEKVSTIPLTDGVAILKGEYRSSDSQSNATKKPKVFTTKVTLTDDLDKLIRNSGVERKVEPPNPWIGNLLLTLLPILIVVVLIYVLFARQMKLAGKGAMQFGKSRARKLSHNGKKITFADVAGAEEAKEETKELVDYLKDPLKFKLLGGKIPKGALLTGPPGTGKTLLAKAVAGEADVPFFTISGSDFVEMFVGVGASRVRDMFEQAKQEAPCILFIDEIDAVGRSRFSGIGGGHDEREQTLNALLVEMDGMETQEGIIIIAATNRPDVLDPALTRPGRLDRQIVLDLPDIKGRREILDVHVKEVKVAGDVDLDIVAKGTSGFSGADLANLINEAALLAARFDKKAADMSDFNEARDKVRWGRERKSRKVNDEDRRITAYHEAGHTLVALNCPKSTPVHKVTIIPRGNAYLGATMSMPEEDRYTQSKTEMQDELTVLMGGRCAEEIAFDEITSGASADIAQATKMAKAMVCYFGMSEKMGNVQYGNRSEHIFIGRDITKSEDYSEQTAREIDIEIKTFIRDATKRAENILRDKKDKLSLLAETLLQKETLDIKEIKELLVI
ncbi:MAG: ATP-dependent zinc metalloprotease FtsH [Kiritimatiellaeota bacterium]|nr:ATP-dependent zinc metalloprotease FtsH [Kiritimatiellota bacterium]